MKKRILSSLLAMLMLVSLLPMQVFAAEGEVTRIQWLQKLTETFDMTVEADNYPDNYYSDVSSSDSYYRDVMVATEFGLIDQEPGTELKPNEPATREFAAHTLNFCLGYELEEGTTYTFTDSAALTYADDAQIAVNRNWFALVDGKFMPEQAITNGEMTAMIADAAEVLADSEIDEGHDNVFTFKDGIKVIPQGTPVQQNEDGSITFTGNIAIEKGDVVAVFLRDIPSGYTVEMVTASNGVTTFTGTETSLGDYIESIDAQGSSEGDYLDFVPAEGATVTYILNDGTQTQSRARAVARGSNAIKDINITIPASIGKANASLTVSMTHAKIDWKVDLKRPAVNSYAMAQLKADITTTFTGKMKVGETLVIGQWRIPGLGSISITGAVSCEGKIVITERGNLAAGFEFSGGCFRDIRNYKATSFTTDTTVSGVVSVTAAAEINVVDKLIAGISASAGVQAEYRRTDRTPETPARCENIRAWLFVKYDIYANIPGLDPYRNTVYIFNERNSPAKINFHYEDGKQVAKCTYGDYGDYYTCGDSHYGYGCSGFGSSTGLNSAGEPYTIFEYSLDEDNNATITKYYGNVAAISVPETLDGYTVIAIGNDAFKGRAELISVVIPSTITTINGGAFYGCSNLSNLVLQDGLKTIKGQAFAKCVSLTTLELPNSVLKVESGAFAKCSSLANVKLSKALTQLDAFAFFDCDALTAIEIPKSLIKSDGAYIHEYANTPQNGPFYGCDGLKDVTFEEGTTAIPGGLFANCPGLESIETPNTITEIGNNAFYNSKNLSSVKLSESLTTICHKAFALCVKLEKVEMPDSVLKVESGAFAKCSSLANVKLSKALTQLDAFAFFDCDALTAIEIPKSLIKSDGAYIHEYANTPQNGPFYGCDGLKDVTFEEGTTVIPTGLFANCPGLESIVLPSTITRIGQEAFLRCKNLKTVELKDGLQQIDTSAFNNCTSMTEISIPDTVSSMGTYVFESCSSLKMAKLPNIRERIMAYTFENCTSLEKIVLPDTVTEIQDHAFKNCTSLKDIAWSKSINTIKDYAFENCDALTEVKVPNSVTSISAGAFYDCDGLASASIPDSVTSVGEKLFYDCDALTVVKLGTGITTIPENTFNHCDALENIVVPRRVTTIGNCAFKDCVKLTEITIPRAVTSISANAFSYPAKMTIYGVAGTYAETFANDNSIKFVDRQINATSATLDKTMLTLNKGSSTKLYLSVQPTDFTDEVNWKSANTSVVTVAADGTVKAVGVGTTTIKVTVGNASASCKVTVVQPVTSISLNKTSLSMEALSTYQLTATAYPNDAYDKSVKWESSDNSVATVSENGLVTAVGKGTATIKATSTAVSSVSRSCTVTVTNNGIVAKDVAQLESPHNYGNNCSDVWLYTLPGASKITATFDKRTNIEDGFDYLYIYNAKGEQVGKYTGTELAGKSIDIDGDTVKIKLVSDGGGNEWGFKVTDVKVASGAHVHSYTSIVTAPTCTEKGHTTHTCACGDSYVDSYTDALGHSYGTWKQTKAPTCTAKGTEARTCTRCNASETRGVNALGHDLKHHAAKAATCTEKGWAAYDTCSRCNYTTYEEIPALGHSYGNWTQTKAPTCTAKGTETGRCTRCNAAQTRDVAALGHSYKNGTCTRCGAADPNYKPAPKAPELKITTSAGKPKIYWNAVDGATKYWIYRSTDGKKFSYYDSTTKTSYTNNSTSIGTTYYYKVKAVAGVDGKNYASDYSVIRSILCKPAAPSVSINRSNGKPKLSWKAVSGATKYWIYRSTDGKNFKYWDSTTKTSYTNSGAASGTKYYYRVKAVAVVNGKNVESASSNVKSLMTSLATPSVSITTSNGKPKLTWKVVTGADKYYVYRSTDGKTFSYWDSTSKTTFVNSGAKKNTKYYYKVKAVCAANSNANSAQSASVSIKATK